ncbi:MAG: GvpL/GvpF family gas vesicle protein [Vicinamibacterales bacterium]
MAWYVFALVDRPPSPRLGGGISGPLSMRKLAGAFAVVERRADVPPVAFGTLKKHQAVVSRLARQVPAILPVRFGTLLEAPELDEALDERDSEIADAFDLVRDRVQFTWRASRRSRRAAPARAPVASGTEYLRRAARQANPPPPAVFKPLRATLASLTVRQRYQPGTGTMPESLYHLVAKHDVGRYTEAAAALPDTSAALTMSGPLPPFAFAPEIL